MHPRLILLIFGLLPAIAMIVVLHGQSREAIRLGVVIEDHGPIEAARVRVRGLPLETITDVRGQYWFPELPRGTAITAWKRGYLIGGGVDSTIPLTPLPQLDCDRYEWVDPTPDPRRPTQCGNCHAAIYHEWSQSGHARSSRSPTFRAALVDVGRHLPDGISVCSSCHTPTQSKLLMDETPPPSGLDGIHCDFCHKIAGPGTGPFGTTHGRYQLRLLRPDPEASPHQLFFGPLEDVNRGEDVYSPFQRDSRLCAACHEGIVFGVHAYSTYSEWLASPARRQGKSCQSCHMAPTGRMTNIAPGKGGIDRQPMTLGRHHMFEPDRLTMLRACLKLELRHRHEHSNGVLDVILTAQGVGHRIPTGFPDRALIVRVRWFDAMGIECDEVAEYRLAKQLVDRDEGHTAAPFWRADPHFVDTRLQPELPRILPFHIPTAAARASIEILERRILPRNEGDPNFPNRVLSVDWNAASPSK